MTVAGVAAGVVPLPGGHAETAAIARGAVEQPAAAAGSAASSSSPTTSAVSAVEAASAPSTTSPAGPSPVKANIRVATPTTRGPRPTTTAASATPAPAPTAPAPAALIKAARRIPSGAEVQAAISGLKQRVGGLMLLVPPTPAQIAQAGDQICTAFDNGQTFAQVKATGLSMVPPSVPVTPATADWAVRTAVSMYCPGYASKLV